MPPASPRWRQELLEAMALDIPGVRPAVIGPATLAGLRELLAFRHFMRHAYAVDLQSERLLTLADLLAGLHGQLATELDRFEAVLAAVAGASTAEGERNGP